jgi:hypothetical protein
MSPVIESLDPTPRVFLCGDLRAIEALLLLQDEGAALAAEPHREAPVCGIEHDIESSHRFSVLDTVIGDRNEPLDGAG